MKHWISTLLVSAAALTLTVDAIAQAGTEVRVRESSNRSMAAAQADAYNGPKARIAVARFDNKTADSQNWYSPSIGDGMADMLTTALVNTGRYIVLERESLDTVLDEQDLGASGRVREDTAAAIGEIEGAELMVVAAVTEFSGDAGGTSGSIGGGKIGKVFGALSGGSRKAHMAIDLRVVDATTSRILAATSVEGEAKDFNLGGALAGYTGSVGLGGSLSGWKNTPREKALRQVIGAAVDYVVSVTPQSMLRYDAAGRPMQASSGGGGGGSAGGAAAEGDQVVVTVATQAHQGPDESSDVVFDLGSGTIVNASIRAGEWIQVVDDQGRTGWVPTGNTLDVQ
ncbi:MAG: CsgG/HfaB family protein [Candidatus Wenzhouxiangella sp. M2_3B_020]